MMKKINIGVTGVNPLNGNRGVGALAISAVHLLQRIANETNSNVEVFAINQHNSNYSINVNNDIIKFKNIPAFDPFHFKALVKIFSHPKYIKSIKAYIQLDYILSVGEGDSFSDIYGKNRFKAIDNQHKLARLFRKKYALLPQTIGPFKNNSIKKQALKSINSADFVFARDSQSFKYVKDNSNQRNVMEAIDLAFFMPFNKQEFKKDYIHVGLNISGLLWNGGYTKNNQFGLRCNYQDLIRSIIKYFISFDKIKIHLVPHVVNQNSILENDYEVSDNLAQELNNEKIILSSFFLNPITAKNYISGLDFFVGSRMHSTIAAFSAGVPVFPIAYSRKFNGLFRDTLKYQFMGDMVSEEKATIQEGLREAYENRYEVASIVKNRMVTIVSEKEKLLIKELTDLLKIK